MTETERPYVAKPVSRRQSATLATASASALALHLDCSRAYIGKLEAEGVIQRQGDGFPLDLSRVAYLRYLRRERQQSPRAAADATHLAVIDGIAGVTLTALLSLPRGARRVVILRSGVASSGSCSRCAPRSPTSANGWPTNATSRRSMSGTDAMTDRGEDRKIMFLAGRSLSPAGPDRGSSRAYTHKSRMLTGGDVRTALGSGHPGQPSTSLLWAARSRHPF
jgi:hypothetical protein